MAERLDVLRSWLHRAAQAGAGRVSRLRSIRQLRRAFEELRQRRASLGEATLGAAVAHAPGVSAATVSVDGGRVRVEATFEDGESRVFAVRPEQARFAPRGAKEVLFEVEPPEAVREARVRDVVGSLAAVIARALWGPVLGPREGDEQALVEREGARLRADLRSVPAVRDALEGPLGVALDLLAIESFAIEERELRIRVALPRLPS